VFADSERTRVAAAAQWTLGEQVSDEDNP
jgi:hypothetical protein